MGAWWRSHQHIMRRRYSVLHICIILLTAWTQKKTRSQESFITVGPEDYDEGEINAERSHSGIMPNYEFVPDFGWYRLHTIPAIWEDARLRCNMEGGVLAAPTSRAVITLIKDTMNRYGLQNVFVDIIATKPKGNFSSLNGKALVDLDLPWAKGEPNNLDNAENCLAMSSDGHLGDVSCTQVLQYLCVNTKEIPHYKCDTTVEGYQINQELESCYKFFSDPVPWRRALMICNAEHAYLAVINSDKESLALTDLYKQHPESTIVGSTLQNRVSIGMWDWEELREFKTIHGEDLDKAGFGKWAKYHPSEQSQKWNCGSMTRDGLLSDIDCLLAKQPFICEVEIK